jgi:hypothetical protein
MPGFSPGIHAKKNIRTGMAGTSPAMTINQEPDPKKLELKARVS